MPEHPFVSVLVAARNEAACIESCLHALARLHYPADRYEVLIGNDGSTDETAALVRSFIANAPHFQLFSLTDEPDDEPSAPPAINGKARVLAHLTDHAQGEFLFITDADVQVPPTWLTALLQAFTPQTGIVTGTTLVAGQSLWARLQAADWLLAFGLIHLGTRLHLPLTGSGNNLAVRRGAYEAVGGFRGLPFSVVEDYTLFQAVVARGYAYAHCLNADVLAQTQPTPTLTSYLQQRKRWMRGAFALPLPLLGGVLFQYLLVPFLLLLSLFSVRLALLIYGFKWLLQTVLFAWVLHQTNQRHRWPDALLYEPYQVLLGTLSIVYYLLPIPIRWKGRTY